MEGYLGLWHTSPGKPTLRAPCARPETRVPPPCVKQASLNESERVGFAFAQDGPCLPARCVAGSPSRIVAPALSALAATLQATMSPMRRGRPYGSHCATRVSSSRCRHGIPGLYKKKNKTIGRARAFRAAPRPLQSRSGKERATAPTHPMSFG